MLRLIGARLGAPLAMQVASSFIYEAHRDGTAPQVAATRRWPGRSDPRVAAAVARMMARLDDPETIQVTACAVGVTQRRLEMLFRTELGMGPGAYGRNLRLQAARRLVVDTSHPLQEVALRCGFSSQAAFARAFRQHFGQSASAMRGSA